MVHCLEAQDSEAVVLMTQIKYGPLWWKTRMGAQLQISCSAVLHFFRMNSKGLKPPPLGIEFPFHFKTIPPLSGWSLTPGYYRHSVQGKVERRIYFSVTPHFTAHLLLQSSLMTNSSLTHHIFPSPSFAQPPFFTILTRGLLIIFQTSMGVLQKPTSAAMKRSFA